jgi:hypothetical protein
VWSDGPPSQPNRWESARDRIERLVATNRLQRSDIDRAITMWAERWQTPLILPNGDPVTISLSDLYHALVAPRVVRRPERIERAVAGVFEIRTASTSSRRVCLSEWDEAGTRLYATVILEISGQLRTIHIVDARKLRKEQRKGYLLWKR